MLAGSQPWSDRFVDGALIVSPTSPGQSILDLSREHVIEAFERYGTLLFRGFELDPVAELSRYTDRYTEKYAYDLVERQSRFEQKMVRNVSLGNYAIDLHSEASYAAVWPEIIWFYCNAPPTSEGATTLCDGLMLWKKLPAALQKLFLRCPLKYEFSLPVPITSRAEAGSMEWPFPTPGISGQYDKAARVFHLSVVRFAVHESRLRKVNAMVDLPAFVNYLLLSGVHKKGHNVIKGVSFVDGTPITSTMMEEIAGIAEPLILDVDWRPRDLVMIDNRRYMHGRRFYPAGDPRDIVQVQTARASFPFGATTRKQTAPVPSTTSVS